MSIISTTVDIAGALSMALGGIGLMNEAYRWIAFRVVDGRVVRYEPVLDSQGKPTTGAKPWLAFEVGGVEVEHRSNSTSYENEIAAHPVGSTARVRFLPSNPAVPEFAPTFKGSFIFPVGALVVGAALFVIGSFLA